jgi:hypothetical protein
MGVVKLKQVTEYNALLMVFPNKYNHVAHLVVLDRFLIAVCLKSCHDDSKTLLVSHHHH